MRVFRRIRRERVATQTLAPLFPAFVEDYDWRTILLGAWAKLASIHEKEGRIVLAGLRRLCRSAWDHRQTHLALCDNNSALPSYAESRLAYAGLLLPREVRTEKRLVPFRSPP
jgi:hypothetical protein